ncbi:MAG: hypothetical protein IPN62_18405 [Flavobacteriales bacterium]|jgi:hypothetical protein|nr:hypothetical protein [Flavobacteriales bacterium]
MKTSFTGTHPLVIAAAGRVDQLLADPLFFERIRQHARFDMSTATPAQIADLMQSSNATVKIELYKSKWPWSKALAYEDHRFPNTVFLNERRLNRSLASICATIMHEAVHSVDATAPDLRFGHGDNNPNQKENTAPYWIGDLAYEMVSGNPAEFAQLFADMDSEWT